MNIFITDWYSYVFISQFGSSGYFESPFTRHGPGDLTQGHGPFGPPPTVWSSPLITWDLGGGFGSR